MDAINEAEAPVTSQDTVSVTPQATHLRNGFRVPQGTKVVYPDLSSLGIRMAAICGLPWGALPWGLLGRRIPVKPRVPAPCPACDAGLKKVAVQITPLPFGSSGYVKWSLGAFVPDVETDPHAAMRHYLSSDVPCSEKNGE